MTRSAKVATAAASLLLAVLASPTSALDSVAPAADLQRVAAPEVGVAASFPADWRVMVPMRSRISWYHESAGDQTPVYAWTAIFATADGGRWCGIDRYEDFPWSLAEHTRFLEHWHVSGSLSGTTGGLEAVELPSGLAYRIDIHSPLTERSTRLYLLQHGHDQVLLTCADALGSSEDWLEIAASIELGPRTAEAIDSVPNRLDLSAAAEAE